MKHDLLTNLIIREMCAGDLVFAAECTAAEGWLSEDYTTLQGFYKNDPSGCFISEEDGHPVGICIATDYAHSGFIGELIVRPQSRQRGVGEALLNHAVQALKARGVGSIYLDGVVKAVSLYERKGFVKVCRSWRFSGHLQGINHTDVRRMDPNDLEQILALDQSSFGADRSFFLKRRLAIFPKLCFVQVEGGRVTGFIMGRQHTGWISAGPWVMQPQTVDPLNLLYAFALEAGERPISIGILEANSKACDLGRSLGFVERPDSPWRMVLNGTPNLGMSPCCYAIGSAAKG
jgi:ribosomal protein S18 acetylase RimI-like enzyme